METAPQTLLLPESVSASGAYAMAACRLITQDYLLRPQMRNQRTRMVHIIPDHHFPGLNMFYPALKRSIDLAASLAFVLLFFWVFAAVWAVVRLDSPGPAIFRQARVGHNGRIFTCYKFRTMFVATPQVATHEVSGLAVTRSGVVLRSTKLDELPQLFNVIFGQMSLVGPRPCLPNQTELIAERQARGVFSIRPGITGLAQVNDIDMSVPKLLAEWDQRYLQERSIWLDTQILIGTVLGNGAGDRVSRG